MQIQVMGHYRCPDYAHRDVKCPFRKVWYKPLRHTAPLGARGENFKNKAEADCNDEREDEALKFPHPEVLNREKEKRVKRSDDYAPYQGDAEEQVESDGGAEHFGKIARGDGNLGENPERMAYRTRVVVATGLSEIPPCNDAESRGQGLQYHGHHVGHQQDPDQRVSETCPSLEVRSPVPRIHVTHAYEVRRSEESKHALRRCLLPLG